MTIETKIVEGIKRQRSTSENTFEDKYITEYKIEKIEEPETTEIIYDEKQSSPLPCDNFKSEEETTGGGSLEYIPPDDILEQIESLLGSTSNGFAVLFGGDGETERQTPSGGDCASTSTNAYTTVPVVESEVLPLETPQQTQNLETVQISKLKRLMFETPRTVKKKKNDGHRAARNLAIAEYLTAKKQLLINKNHNLKLKNEKLMLEIKKMKKSMYNKKKYI